MTFDLLFGVIMKKIILSHFNENKQKLRSKPAKYGLLVSALKANVLKLLCKFFFFPDSEVDLLDILQRL